MFMRYVHTEDDPVRAAAEAATQRRMTVIGSEPRPSGSAPPAPEPPPNASAAEPAIAAFGPDDKPLGFEDGKYPSRTRLGNYRPFRHRMGANRAVPPGDKRTKPAKASHA